VKYTRVLRGWLFYFNGGTDELEKAFIWEMGGSLKIPEIIPSKSTPHKAN
jgi:hypothetical protein